MKSKLLLGILSLLFCNSAFSQQIKLHFDYENADRTLEYLEMDRPNEAALDRLTAFEGSLGLMQKNKVDKGSMIQARGIDWEPSSLVKYPQSNGWE